MAKESRNFSLILLIVFLVTGITVFIGCGGGGGSGDDPLPLAIITGKITSPSKLTSILSNDISSLRAVETTSGIEVYIESNRTGHSTYTDSSGNFVLENIPAGSYNIIALIKTTSGKTYKVRSSRVSITDPHGTTILPSLGLKQSTNVVSGKIKDTNGHGVANAQLTLWGENFRTDSYGVFTTPPMPPSTSAEIKGAIPGFQPFSIPTSFNSITGQTIEQVVVPTSATNRAPSVSLSATRYSISPNEQITLTASATDPDGNTLAYTWANTDGITGSFNNSYNTWTAPSYSTIATITCMVSDGNLTSEAKVTINVGNATQSTGTNYPPSVLSIDSSTMTFYNNMNYQLTAVATDANNDTLKYSWSTTQGTISPINTSVVNWLTPDVATTTYVTISATVQDTRGGKDSLTATYTVSVNPNPAVNKIPVTSISLPVNNALLPTGLVNYSGSATDPEDGVLDPSKLTWRLSVNGATSTIVGQGKSGISRMEMYPGNYVVTLEAVDSNKATGTTSVSFRINATPTASIISPADKSLFQLGASIPFRATATDHEDGTIQAGNFMWRLTASDTRTGANIDYSSLPAGTQTIELAVKDRIGAKSASQSIQVYINSNPTITSITPANGFNSLQGKAVTFSLVASDVDSTILPTDVEWLEGATSLGKGNPLPVTTLTAGTHTIIASVTDRMGGHTSSTTVVIITNRPTMAIATPANNQVIALTQPVTFSGSGIANLVAVSSATMKWDDYNFNTNATSTNISHSVAQFSKTYTSIQDLGRHRITLTGADQYGATGTTSVTMYVNATPTISITAPASGTRFDHDTSITFDSTPHDDDPSDTLSIVWFSGTTPIASGKSPSIATLTAGNHNISAVVSDTHSTDATASMSVLVNTLPTASITWSTPQYATATGNIPVFLSGNAIMPITFTAVTNDAEIGGPITNTANIRWYKEDPSGNLVHIANGTSITEGMSVGVSTITLRVYDNFYPAFEHQASVTKTLRVYVWQSLIYNYGTSGLLANARFIAGNAAPNPVMHLSFDNGASTPIVKQMTFNGGSTVLSDNNTYSLATYSFVNIAAADLLAGQLTAIGYRGANGADPQLGMFTNTIASEPVYNPDANLTNPVAFCSNGESGGLARGYACNKIDNNIIIINPANKTSIAYSTTPSGDPYDSPSSIRRRTVSYGRVFVADTGKNRIVRLKDDLTSFSTSHIVATAPEDIAFSNSFLFVVNSTADTNISIIEPVTQTEIIQFGVDRPSGTDIGKFRFTPGLPARIFCSGSDLFVLESDRLQVIRSGLTDWFK